MARNARHVLKDHTLQVPTQPKLQRRKPSKMCKWATGARGRRPSQGREQTRQLHPTCRPSAERWNGTHGNCEREDRGKAATQKGQPGQGPTRPDRKPHPRAGEPTDPGTAAPHGRRAPAGESQREERTSCARAPTYGTGKRKRRKRGGGKAKAAGNGTF